MKHGWITFTLVLTALVALAGSALGEVMLIEYVDTSTYGNAGTRIQLSDGTTPTGNSLALDNYEQSPAQFLEQRHRVDR